MTTARALPRRRWWPRAAVAAVGAAGLLCWQAVPAFAGPVLAEGHYGPYDQGVRHIATIAGYLSYGLMALTVCFGVLTTTGWARTMVKRQTLQGGHMLLAVVSLTFGCLHALAYVFQTGEHFTWVQAVIPFAGGGEPEVAMGIVGLELALAVSVSIWLQRRLGYRRWHVLHYLAYVAFALSLAHTVATSAEVQALGLVGIAVAGCAGACLLLGVLRTLPATTAVKTRIAAQEL